MQRRRQQRQHVNISETAKNVLQSEQKNLLDFYFRRSVRFATYCSSQYVGKWKRRSNLKCDFQRECSGAYFCCCQFCISRHLNPCAALSLACSLHLVILYLWVRRSQSSLINLAAPIEATNNLLHLRCPGGMNGAAELSNQLESEIVFGTAMNFVLECSYIFNAFNSLPKNVESIWYSKIAD